MPIYQLYDEIVFPHPKLAEKDGLLAVGGDLSPDRIILAYENGIFPWYSEGDPILWWSPNPRFVMFPDKLNISKTMKKVLNRNEFHITFDKCFREVMKSCGDLRRETGTWINEDMLEAYCRLHELGFAHSVETWKDGELVGGFYGISMGKCFFGESMFSKVDNASKAAFITFVKELQRLGFHVIDCQVYTKHLESLGAEAITRDYYLKLIKNGIRAEKLDYIKNTMLISKEEIL